MIAPAPPAGDTTSAGPGPVPSAADLRRWAGGGTRGALGLVLGVVSSVVHLFLLIPAGLATLVAAGRRTVPAVAARLAHVEVVRVGTLLGGPAPGPLDGERSARYLLARMPAGLLGGALLWLLGFGLVVAVTMLLSWSTATPLLVDPKIVVTDKVFGLWLLPGLLLLYMVIAGLVGVARWERALAARLLAPTAEEQLTRRVAALAESRAAIVAAVDDERRRIERDLHDGVQQRLVALGMLLGRARRHPERLELVVQAHEQAQRALAELREVSWRVYPAALDTEGLAAALEAVAERAPLPVRIQCDLPAEPPADVRAVAWFVVCEAVTNAAKHSGAGAVEVEVAATATGLHAVVTDDGRGGADPSGGGLAGLARRVAASDGMLSISSPPGGPTVVRAELPCG